MDTSTLMSQLTADIIAKINDLQDNSELLQAVKELSAVPLNPYDRLKHEYLGADYKFPTINDIEIPTDFNPITITSHLTGISQKHTEQAIKDATTLQAQITAAALDDVNHDKIMFDEIVRTDPETVKKNIIFTELVNSVTIHDVNHRPVETLQKLLSFYTNLYLT